MRAVEYKPFADATCTAVKPFFSQHLWMCYVHLYMGLEQVGKHGCTAICGLTYGNVQKCTYVRLCTAIHAKAPCTAKPRLKLQLLALLSFIESVGGLSSALVL